VDLPTELEDGAPRDIDHKSSNPDRPLAGAGDGTPEVGVRLGAAEVDGRVGTVDAVGESGREDAQRLFCTGALGVVVKVCDCLLLVVGESKLKDAL